MPLNIGLDWDDTFTADPETFVKLIALFKAAGHNVYITTARHPIDAWECQKVLNDKYDIADVPVHGTTYLAKRPHMADLGIHIDIWIDDHPLRVNFDEHVEHKVREHM